jgi:hypothetical protein
MPHVDVVDSGVGVTKLKDALIFASAGFFVSSNLHSPNTLPTGNMKQRFSSLDVKVRITLALMPVG